MAQALGEVTAEARARVEGLIRNARSGVSGSWVVGVGGVGLPVKPWYEGLGPAGFEERDRLLAYLAAAERHLEIGLEELERGEEPSAEVAAERDAAAAECAAFEASHPAPAGMPSARDRWASGG